MSPKLKRLLDKLTDGVPMHEQFWLIRDITKQAKYENCTEVLTWIQEAVDRAKARARKQSYN